MCDDTYNGWTNRETWATHLWLSSYPCLWDEVRAWLKMQGDKALVVESYVEYLRDELDDLHPYYGEDDVDLRSMFHDIGSLWRVDWREVAEALEEE